MYVRLKEGEVNILGGLFERTVQNNLNGIPGIGEVPGLGYLFSDNNHQVNEDETLIVLTPHVLRMPSVSAQNLRPMAAGTDSNVRIYHEDATVETPATAPPGVQVVPQAARPNAAVAAPGVTPTSMAQQAQAESATAAQQPGAAVQLHFEPATMAMKPGDTTTLGLAISNVNDLFSIPLMIHYDPSVIQVEEVRNGGFLSGGTQEIAVVQRIDQQKGEVVVSATRQPNTCWRKRHRDRFGPGGARRRSGNREAANSASERPQFAAATHPHCVRRSHRPGALRSMIWNSNGVSSLSGAQAARWLCGSHASGTGCGLRDPDSSGVDFGATGAQSGEARKRRSAPPRPARDARRH